MKMLCYTENWQTSDTLYVTGNVAFSGSSDFTLECDEAALVRVFNIAAYSSEIIIM